MELNVRRRPVDFLFPLTIAFLMALIAAALGFVAGIALCSWLLSGEMSEWGLLVAPILAVVFGLAALLYTFRRLT